MTLKGLAIDVSGNLYIVDNGNNCIRKVSTNGIITTYAGKADPRGQGSYGGDGGPADSAQLSLPTGVAVDGLGNVYIADLGNVRVRKVNIQGIISTVAGGGTKGLGDGGAADSAELTPWGVALDASGNMYIADFYGNRIRKVNTNGIISTIAGDSDGNYSGDGGPATASALNNPTGVIIDATGNIYITDSGDFRIRKVNTNGIISTYAGDGISGYSGDGGLATTAKMGYIPALAIDGSGNVYITDTDFNRIRVIYSSSSMNI